MFLLVTGASGAGKSTARRLIAGDLGSGVDCVELYDVVDVPRVPTIAWRQQATEAVVRHALELQAQDRHLLLAGDPIAAGEVLAAPSADRLDAIAVCLLDVDEEAQTARLAARGDDPKLLVQHLAFARWMRGHARDPRHMPHVLQTNAWEEMRWERWVEGRDEYSWTMHVIDSSPLSLEEVAAELLGWCRRALASQAPTMRAAADPCR
jgi:hypothetical protein